MVTHSALSFNREFCIFILRLMEPCAVGSSFWVLSCYYLTTPVLWGAPSVFFPVITSPLLCCGELLLGSFLLLPHHSYFWYAWACCNRETNLTSNLRSCRKEGDKCAWQRETSLMSVLSPCRKKEGKHAWQRQTSVTSDISPSLAVTHWWGCNRSGAGFTCVVVWSVLLN